MFKRSLFYGLFFMLITLGFKTQAQSANAIFVENTTACQIEGKFYAQGYTVGAGGAYIANGANTLAGYNTAANSFEVVPVTVAAGSLEAQALELVAVVGPITFPPVHPTLGNTTIPLGSCPCGNLMVTITRNHILYWIQ